MCSGANSRSASYRTVSSVGRGRTEKRLLKRRPHLKCRIGFRNICGRFAGQVNRPFFCLLHLPGGLWLFVVGAFDGAFAGRRFVSDDLSGAGLFRYFLLSQKLWSGDKRAGAGRAVCRSRPLSAGVGSPERERFPVWKSTADGPCVLSPYAAGFAGEVAAVPFF